MYHSPPNVDRKPRYLEYAVAIATAAMGGVTAVASPISYWTKLLAIHPPACRLSWERAAFIGLAVLATLLAIGVVLVVLRHRRDPYMIQIRLYWGLIGAFWLAWLTLAFHVSPQLDTFWVMCRMLVDSN